MNSKRVFFKIGTKMLGQFGYECVEIPQFQGIRFYFLRKCLGENIYAFIAFHQYSYVNLVINGEQLPRTFDLTMWRNIGDIPRHGYNPNEENLPNWIFLSLPQLLWFVLKINIYEGPNHIWKYHNEEELVTQLEDAFEKMIEYGIPWLENPDSKNPY
jgi:hypothetical protein